jgi:hypothetical protein
MRFFLDGDGLIEASADSPPPDPEASPGARNLSHATIRNAFHEMLQWADPAATIARRNGSSPAPFLAPEDVARQPRNGGRAYTGQFNGTSSDLRGLAESGQAPVSSRISEMPSSAGSWDNKSGQEAAVCLSCCGCVSSWSLGPRCTLFAVVLSRGILSFWSGQQQAPLLVCCL